MEDYLGHAADQLDGRQVDGYHGVPFSHCRSHGLRKMNKSELIDKIAESADISKASAGRALDATIEASLAKDNACH